MRLYTLLLLILFFKSVTGQQLFIQKYPTEIHHASMQNWDIVQDKQGRLYFANTEGVLIFDGIHWELLVLPGNAYVSTLAADQSGKVYVGTEDEFGYLARTTDGSFKYVSLMPLLEEKSRREIRHVLDIEVLGESVFFSDEVHCYKYEKDTIEVLDNANLWMIPLRDSLYALDDSGSKIYVYKNNKFSAINLDLENFKIQLIAPYAAKRFLLLDDKNRIWIMDPGAASKEKMFVLAEGINASVKDLSINKICALHDGTSGEKGSGLGLMLCREFIEKNGAGLTFKARKVLEVRFHLVYLYKQVNS